MIRGLSILLIASVALYWYTAVGQVCGAPLTYHLASLDERFALTQAEALAMLQEAETVWEQGAGRDLFTLSTDNHSDIAIHFVFDERQQKAMAEEALRDSLESKEQTTEELNAAYKALVAEYEQKRSDHEVKVVAYEKRLAVYNADVEAYNADGGAPPAAYARLTAREENLKADMVALDKDGEELNRLAEAVNQLGEQSNQLISQYNAGVNTYNNTFSSGEEFTQGDYENGQINIYTFKDKTELVTVLAHEFGHALDIDHVEGKESIMYYLMEDQPTPPVLSEADQAEFINICGASDTVGTSVRALINKYIL